MKTTLSSIYFGQRNPDFDYKDYNLIKKLKRLYLKHHKQCENDCNGYGVVKGQMYYTGTIDDYARREYGYNVKSGYVSEDTTVFDAEIKRLEDKILLLLGVYHYGVSFQHDPRGLTVKWYYNGSLIDWRLF